jgi:RND family efflux transporter MFP subunit
MKALRIFPLFFFLLFACNQPVEQASNGNDFINVKTQAPLLVEYQDPVRASGVLATRTELKLSFKTGGIINSVNVTEGQSVKEGDVLAVLDLSEIDAQVKQASIAYDKGKRDYNRALNSYRDSVATLETLQNAKSAYDLSKSMKRIADFNMKHSRIIAPSKGKVLKIVAKKNEIIGPGYPAILFASTENDWIVRLALVDKDIVKFVTGDSASIQMDAFPDQVYSAVVSELGSLADPLTGTYEVELLMKDENPNFRTGFIARAYLFPSDLIFGWWLPFESVQNLDNKQGHVFVEDSLVVKKRVVKTGAMINDGILITEGVHEDDQIVTEGASYLKDGSLINVVATKKAE